MFKKIYIEITNICNLNCQFCPETQRVKMVMASEDFEKVMKKISQYTNMVCLHVKGEPLMHPDLERILKIIDKYHLKVSITTNGLLLKEKIDILKKAKALSQINISLHSLSQNNLPPQEYLEDIFKSADNLSNVMISYRMWNLKSILENSINNELINKLSSYYHLTNLKESLMTKPFYKINEHLFINEDTMFIWPDINGPEIISKGKCLALKEQIAILVDGTVVPCCLDHNGDIPLGNIFNESLEDIFQKDLTKAIKKNFEGHLITCKLCHTCGFLKRLEEKRKASGTKV